MASRRTHRQRSTAGQRRLPLVATASTVTKVADELICSADLDGYYTDVNPAFTRLLGWSEADLINRPYLDFVHPSDRRTTATSIARLRRSGKLMKIRNRVVAKDGRTVWIEWSAYFHEDTIYAIGHEVAENEEAKLEEIVVRVFREQATAAEDRLERLQEKRESDQSARSMAERSATLANTRAQTFKIWIGALVSLAVLVGGAFTWAINRVEEGAHRAHELEARTQEVDEELGKLDERLSNSEAKNQRLGELVDETQIQVSESTSYIVKKLDAANPKLKDAVEEPRAVELARDKVELLKKDRRIEDLFKRDPEQPGNPFAGLDTEPGTRED